VALFFITSLDKTTFLNYALKDQICILPPIRDKTCPQILPLYSNLVQENLSQMMSRSKRDSNLSKNPICVEQQQLAAQFGAV
jgi:hypothetical protein